MLLHSIDHYRVMLDDVGHEKRIMGLGITFCAGDAWNSPPWMFFVQDYESLLSLPLIKMI